jgi:hypothetical protein
MRLKQRRKGRLAAARRADQRGDLVLLDREVDALQRLEVSIVEVQRIDLRLQFGLDFGSRVVGCSRWLPCFVSLGLTI